MAASILDRTVANLRNAWSRITLSGAGDRRLLELRPDLPDEDADALRRRIAECLEGKGGEVTARARAAEIGQAYLGLDGHGRRRFLEILAHDFAVPRAALDDAIRALQAADEPEPRLRASARLRAVLTPPYRRLLTQFNALPQGVKFLVDMRADLRGHLAGNPELQGLDADFRDLLTVWFDIGFLELRRIGWDSPAALLEKLIAYEAVHEIHSWDDLKNRLASDRRCYAFFHPRMPDEPLIFVEVALVDGMSESIQALLEDAVPVDDPRQADTAIFYSISNTQKGLQGVGLGTFLIKRVADHLARDLPNLQTFATLSPIPGFRRWFDARLADGALGPLTAAERKALKQVAGARGAKGGMKELLDRPGWHRDPAAAAALEGPLTRLCARYLLEQRPGGAVVDPVAHFHLSNGARIERLNWLGDVSEKGLRQSAGLMVNYLYRLEDIERNHESYSRSGQAPVSPAVRTLLKGTSRKT